MLSAIFATKQWSRQLFDLLVARVFFTRWYQEIRTVMSMASVHNTRHRHDDTNFLIPPRYTSSCVDLDLVLRRTNSLRCRATDCRLRTVASVLFIPSWRLTIFLYSTCASGIDSKETHTDLSNSFVCWVQIVFFLQIWWRKRLVRRANFRKAVVQTRSIPFRGKDTRTLSWHDHRTTPQGLEYRVRTHMYCRPLASNCNCRFWSTDLWPKANWQIVCWALFTMCAELCPFDNTSFAFQAHRQQIGDFADIGTVQSARSANSVRNNNWRFQGTTQDELAGVKQTAFLLTKNKEEPPSTPCHPVHPLTYLFWDLLWALQTINKTFFFKSDLQRPNSWAHWSASSLCEDHRHASVSASETFEAAWCRLPRLPGSSTQPFWAFAWVNRTLLHSRWSQVCRVPLS